MNRHTYILISTHFYHRPRWQNWLGLHSVNSMVVGSNPTASNSKFCYFFILALPFSLLFPPFSLPSQRNFPISFKPKVAIAKFIGKMQKKVWYYEKWVGRHASFPPRRSVNHYFILSILSQNSFYTLYNSYQANMYRKKFTLLMMMIPHCIVCTDYGRPERK